MNFPVKPSASAAPVIRRADIDCHNLLKNDIILATNTESHDRPPRYVQSTFVEILKHWVVNKHDDALEVGSLAHNFRKKWMNEKGIEANFSKRKIIVLKMIRDLATSLSVLDLDAAKKMDEDRSLRIMKTTDH